MKTSIQMQIINIAGLYLWPLCWGVCIILSFIGWGSLIGRLFFPRQSINWANRAVWGMSLLVFMGGVLNLFCLISAVIIFAIVFLGLLFFIALDLHSIKRSLVGIFLKLTDFVKTNPLASTVFAVSFFFLFFDYISVDFYNYLIPDDVWQHALYPVNMIQAGSIGADPFNYPRLVSYGGQAFLQALVLSGSDHASLIRLMDSGIAKIIAAGLILWMLRNKQVSYGWASFIFCCFCLLPLHCINASSYMTSLVIFLALFNIFDNEHISEKGGLGGPLVMALLVSAGCALKSNNIVPLVFLIILSYVVNFFTDKQVKMRISGFILFTLLTSVFLLPWMLSLYRSHHTLLYPFLGKGYSIAAFHGISELSGGITYKTIFKNFYAILFESQFFLLLVLSLVALTSGYTRRIIYQVLIIGFCVFLSMNIAFMFKGSIVPRYWFGALYAGIFTLMAILFSGSGVSGLRKSLVAVLIVLSLIVPAVFDTSLYPDSRYSFSWNRVWTIAETKARQYSELIKELKCLALKGKFRNEGNLASYLEAQNSIPEGEKIFVVDLVGYKFNHKRNIIYGSNRAVMLSPGPPPGIFNSRTPKDTANYLLGQGVRYVIIDRRLEVKPVSEKDLKRQASFSTYRVYFDSFVSNILFFAREKNIIYNKDSFIVIDLARNSTK